MKKFKIFFSLLLTLALVFQLGVVAFAAPANAAKFNDEAGFSYQLTAEVNKLGEDGLPIEGETESVLINADNADRLGEGFSLKLGIDSDELAQDALLKDVLDKDLAISVPAGYYVRALSLRAADDTDSVPVDLLKLTEADANSANIKLKAGALTLTDELSNLYLDSSLITGDTMADAFVLDITLSKLDADADVAVTVDGDTLEASTAATEDAPAVFTAREAPEFDANLNSFSGWKLVYANGSSVMVGANAEFSPYASCTLAAVFAPVIHTLNVVVTADKSEYTVGETPLPSASITEDGYTADFNYTVFNKSTETEAETEADINNLTAGSYVLRATVSNVQFNGSAIPAENLKPVVNEFPFTVKAVEEPPVITDPPETTPPATTEPPAPSDDPNGDPIIGGDDPDPVEPTQLTITVKEPKYDEQTKQFVDQGYDVSGLADGDKIEDVKFFYDESSKLFTISTLKIVDADGKEVSVESGSSATLAAETPKYRISIIGAPAEVPAPQGTNVTVTVKNLEFTYDAKEHAPAEADCTTTGLDATLKLVPKFKAETKVCNKNVELESWEIVKSSDSSVVASSSDAKGYTVNVTGTIKINPKDATISIKNDIQFKSNGSTAFKLATGNISASGLIDGHKYALSSHFEKDGKKVESPTEAGEYTIVIDKCEIYDQSQIVDGKATGDPLTANYNLAKNNGKVTITVNANAIPLTITAKSGTFEYDGTAKTVEGWENNVEGLKDGDVLESVKYKSSSTQTIPGESSAEIESVVIKDKNGNAVSNDKYTLNLNPGKITVTKPKLTLTAVSDEKVYDGKALSNNNVKASRDLSKTNFKLSVGLSVTDKAGNSVRNGPVNVGTYTKKISSVKITLNGNDVTEYFDVTCVDGTLTVKSGNGSSSNAGVKTGDESNIGLLIGILAVCAVVIIVMVVILLKKRKPSDAAEAEAETDELPTEPVAEAEDDGIHIDQSVFDQKDDENK